MHRTSYLPLQTSLKIMDLSEKLYRVAITYQIKNNFLIFIWTVLVLSMILKDIIQIVISYFYINLFVENTFSS